MTNRIRRSLILTAALVGLAACKPPVQDTTLLPGILDVERIGLSEKLDTVIVTNNSFGDRVYLVFETPLQGGTPNDLAKTYRQTFRDQGWVEENAYVLILFRKSFSPDCKVNVTVNDIETVRPMKPDWTDEQTGSAVFNIVLGQKDCPGGIEESLITSRYKSIEHLKLPTF